jgi:hypothetical protein
MKFEDHQNDIVEAKHRTLPKHELVRRINDLSKMGGSNPGQLNQSNQLISEYRRELDRRAARRLLYLTFIGTVAAVVAAIASVAALTLQFR